MYIYCIVGRLKKWNVSEAGIPTRRVSPAIFRVMEVHVFRSSIQRFSVVRKSECCHEKGVFIIRRGRKDKYRVNRIMSVAGIIWYLSWENRSEVMLKA